MKVKVRLEMTKHSYYNSLGLIIKVKCPGNWVYRRYIYPIECYSYEYYTDEDVLKEIRGVVEDIEKIKEFITSKLKLKTKILKEAKELKSKQGSLIQDIKKFNKNKYEFDIEV